MRWQRITAGVALAWLLPFACSDGARPDAEPSPDATTNESSLSDTTQDGGRGPTDGRTRPQCSAGGFCYVSVPPATPLSGITAKDIDHVWVISRDAVLQWNGVSWDARYQHIGGDFELQTLASAHDELWATAMGDDGNLVLVRASAAGAFREVSTGEPIGNRYDKLMKGTWLSPSGDALWVVMTTGTVLRFREQAPNEPLVVDRWTPQSADASVVAWTSIWGFGADDLYIGGSLCEPEHLPYCTPIGSMLGHYDGTSFSVVPLETGTSVMSMFGTPPGQPHHLWLTLASPTTDTMATTTLFPVNAGALGSPRFSRQIKLFMKGSFEGNHVPFGVLSSPDAGWFSNGGLVWRWTGSALETMSTAVESTPVGDVYGIWSGSADEAWIVGHAVAQGPDFPTMGFAARRRSGNGGEP